MPSWSQPRGLRCPTHQLVSADGAGVPRPRVIPGSHPVKMQSEWMTSKDTISVHRRGHGRGGAPRSLLKTPWDRGTRTPTLTPTLGSFHACEDWGQQGPGCRPHRSPTSGFEEAELVGGWLALVPGPNPSCSPFQQHLLRSLSLRVGQVGPYLYKESASASAPGML